MAGSRMRRARLLFSMLFVGAIVGCGSGGDFVYIDPASGPSTTSTMSALETTQRGSESVVDVVRLDGERYWVDVVLPVDAGPDPMGETQEPDFVLDSRRWMTECCFLGVTVQSEHPLLLERQLVDTVNIDGLEWRVYNIGGEDGSIMVGVATVHDIAVLVGSQERFPGGEAQETGPLDQVRSVVRTVVIDER